MPEGGSSPLGSVRGDGNAEARIRPRCCRLGSDGASLLPLAVTVVPRVAHGLLGAQGLTCCTPALSAPGNLLQVRRSVRAPLGTTFVPHSMHDLPRNRRAACAIASSSWRSPSHNPIPPPFPVRICSPPLIVAMCAPLSQVGGSSFALSIQLSKDLPLVWGFESNFEARWPRNNPPSKRCRPMYRCGAPASCCAA